MIDRYEEAIGAYDRALQLKSRWKAALDNRLLASIQAKMKERPEGDQNGMTEIGTDEIVFDQDKGENQDSVHGAVVLKFIRTLLMIWIFNLFGEGIQAIRFQANFPF